MTIDTHQGFKELVAAGLPERQAEAVVALFSKGIEGKVVTPDQFSRGMADIDARFAEIDARFEKIEMRFTELEARFDQKLAELEARLVSRLITVVGLSTALIGVLVTVLSFVT